MDDGTPINLTISIDENKVPTGHFEWLFFIIFTFLLLLVLFLLRMGLVQNERLSALILSSLTCWIIAKII